MPITVELPPELEKRFIARAKVEGMSLDAFVKECLSRPVPARAQPQKLSADDMNKLLDEAADLVPDGPALPDEAMSRESIYTREDEW